MIFKPKVLLDLLHIHTLFTMLNNFMV